MKLKSLTYTSRAQLDLCDEDLLAIHESARHFNALNGITGLLIFEGGRFLQFVEGPEDAISELVERLRRDTRHSAFEVRDERHVSRRSFPDWAMELVNVGQYGEHARREVRSRLPCDVSAAVYDLAIRMTSSMPV